ncbi:MAG: type 1 glutamine amidotransferase [Rhodothermales bacterium]|nr:type 1 glutamine amidotransferase [Rhodothermales bacterium]MBO6779738.1 type 1 glutamine amidotransferase [Rhodothermales bacterium]
MSVTQSNSRILLLQARAEPEMELQEQECFVERCRIRPEQLISVNVVRDNLHPGLLDDVQAFMIGGAGAFSACNEYPWMEHALNLIRAAAERGMPTFGSCWGHQMIARAMGGRVEHDGSKAEMGCHHITLTEAGRKDPLFRGFPESFLANMGHHDRVTKLPPGAIELADNASQPNQAFRLAHLPVYGTQFHSELDAKRERERLLAYREHYLEDLPSEEAFQEAVDSLRETTEVDHLLYDFLKLYVAGFAASPAQ